MKLTRAAWVRAQNWVLSFLFWLSLGRGGAGWSRHILDLGDLLQCGKEWYETLCLTQKIVSSWGFPGGSVIKNLPANAGDMGLIPGLEVFHMPWTTKSVCPNCWAWVLEPRNHNYWARVPQYWSPCTLVRALQQKKPPHWEALTL